MIDPEIEALLFGLGFENPTGLLHGKGEISLGCRNLKLPSFDFRQVEHIIQQDSQCAPGLHKNGHLIPLRG